MELTAPVIEKSKKIQPQASRYDNGCCARCGSPISKGTMVEPWFNGPRIGTGGAVRWVHVGCSPRAAVAAAAPVSTEQIKQEVARQLGELTSNMDLSGLEQEVATAMKSELDTFCAKMAGATSEACALTAEEVQKYLVATEKRVQELIETGIPVVITIKKLDGTEHSMKGEHTHPAFEEVLELAAARENIFLPGPAGCGKTHIAQQAATALGLRFGFISCTAGMSEGQLLGRLLPTGDGGRFEYSRSEFVKCYEEGGVFLLDEMDAADSNTLITLNMALANGHMAVPNRPEQPVATRHPDFVCIAAANTFGRGGDRMYVGRNELDEATLSRFQIGTVEMDYDRKLEAKLCPNKELLAFVWKCRDNVAKNRLQRTVSTRFLIKAHKMMAAAGWSLAKVEEKLFGGWSKDEIIKARG